MTSRREGENPGPGEFFDFVSDVAQVVAEHVSNSGGAPTQSSAQLTSIADEFFLDDEKVVWDWPDVSGRVIEDPR
jgi:hypothetical protein